MLDRAAQFAFEVHAFADLLVQAGVEQRVARLAGRLGAVHRDVGVAQHLSGSVSRRC